MRTYLPRLIAGAATALALWLAGAAQGATDGCAASASAAAQPAAVRLLARASRQLAQTPHPMARLHTEGTLPHQGIYDESLMAERDFPVMRDAAVAWRLTGERRYAEQVDAFLRAWTATYVPSYNPIDETNLGPLIQSYAWARDGLSPETRAATGRFLSTLAEGYITRSETHRDSPRPPQSATWTNNWQSHRVKIMAMSAAALDDHTLLAKVEQLFLAQLANNVKPDGSVIDFEQRDALHYVVFDLEPLATAAVAAQPFGRDWLRLKSSTGSSLASALSWLAPYASGERMHQEFVHSQVEFDRTRANAGVAGFSGQWEPKGAATLFQQAAVLDARYRPLAEKLAPAPDWIALCAGQ
jgi:hypothetical protein